MPALTWLIRIPVLRSLERRMGDRAGIIVLGPLILFVCLLVIMVVGGKLLYRAPRDPYIGNARPELQYALSSTDVYASGQVVRTLQPGDSIWGVRLENGSWAVFHDPGGHDAVGITVGLFEPSKSTLNPGAPR